jgi:hypothetical protein
MSFLLGLQKTIKYLSVPLAGEGFMNRLIIVLLSLSLGFVLSGCPGGHNPPPLGSPVPKMNKNVISGDKNVCMVENKKLRCFSEPDTFYPANWSDVATTPFKMVAATDSKYNGERWQSACGITAQDKLSCFKYVTGEVKDILRKTDVSADEFDAIYGNNKVFCGRRSDGILRCFEPNAKKTYDPNNPPAFEDMALGHFEVCGIDASGKNSCLVIGGGTATNVLTSFDNPADEFKGDKFSMIVGYPAWPATYCALDDQQKARCFIINDSRKLPIPPADNIKWQGLTKPGGADNDSLCGIDELKKLWCWTQTKFDPFVDVKKEQVESVYVGEKIGCAIKEDRTRICWQIPVGGYPNL